MLMPMYDQPLPQIKFIESVKQILASTHRVARSQIVLRLLVRVVVAKQHI